MKKYLASVLLLLIAPGMCFGASARYTQLVREKQRKMEQLEKCMGTNKGLQIAGISTLGLTAVGVAGNIAEANIIKKNEKTLEKQNTTLAEKEEEYNRKENAKKDAEKERDDAKENWKNANKLRVFVQRDIDAINALDVTIGTQVVVSGYDPSALPAGDLKNNLATALTGVIRKCKSLEEHNGIKTVSLQDGDKPTWGNTSGNLDLEAVWTETTPRQVMVCNLIECVTPEYHRDGDQCIKTENEEDKNEEKDENKSGGQKSQSNKNGGNQQGGAAVVPGSKKKDSGSSDKDICENSENGGTWTGKTCNCGVEKVWNTKTKRCEVFDETVPDIQKKDGDQCDTAWLTQHNATKGVYHVAEGETGLSCFIQECKHGYHLTLNGKHYDVAKEGLDDEAVCTKDVTGPQKCSQSALNAIKAKDGIVEGGKCKVTTCKGNLRKTSDGLNCECPGNDYKWNETKQTCEKNKQEIPDEKTPVLSVESENVELFKNVKVTFDQGVTLANLYAEKYKLNFDCESGFKPVGYDDYLTCREISGKKYVFHFDSLTGGSDYTPVLDVMCEMYGGSKTKRGNNKIMCLGMNINLCNHMSQSINKVLPNIHASKYHDNFSEKCVFYRD